MPETITVNPEIVEQKVGSAFAAFGGVVVAGMIHLGDRLGLYAQMAGVGPITSAALAEKAGLSERFVREWLLQQAASGVIDHRGGMTFELGPEAALVFADDDNPLSQIANFRFLGPLAGLFMAGSRGFNGLGSTYDDHGEVVARAIDASFGAWNRHSLVGEALPKLPGIVERLQAGGIVADVGCGAGAGPIAIGKAFPKSVVHGFDNSVHAETVARENLERAGVTNVYFHNSDREPLPTEPTYDLVMTLDCLHDMSRPDLALRAIRRAIKPDGMLFIVDIDGAQTPEENLANPMAGFLFGASVGLCLQSSSSAPDGLQLGTFGLPEPKMRELVTASGFSRFGRVEGLEHPFNAYYWARP